MSLFLKKPSSARHKSNPVNQQGRIWGRGGGGAGELQLLSYVHHAALPPVLVEPSWFFQHVAPKMLATLQTMLSLSLSLCLQCMELQCYIYPLSSILNGLRSGRYRERKS